MNNIINDLDSIIDDFFQLTFDKIEKKITKKIRIKKKKNKKIITTSEESREIIKQQNFNIIFGFHKSGTDMLDIILNFRNEIRNHESRERNELCHQVSSKILEFSCGIGPQKIEFGILRERSDRSSVPELINNTFDSLTNIRNEYKYLYSFDDEDHSNHRYLNNNFELVKDLIPILRLFYGKSLTKLIPSNLLKFFTKDCNLRQKFRWKFLGTNFNEFIINQCNQVIAIHNS